MHSRLLPVLTALSLGCELLGSSGATPSLSPTLALGGSALVSAPSAREVAAWYCPEIIGDPITRALCAVTVGPKPQPYQMQFHFELRYKVDNPNGFPIPATEILAALEVFKGKDAAELGAVCVVLCGEGDVQCTGEPGQNSCKADGNEITSIDDFANRLPGLLIATVDAAINGDLDNLARRMIPATTKGFEIRARFSLGLEAMLDILIKVAPQLVDKFLNNQPLNLEIPYMVRGTLWFEIPLLGRVALGYGAFEDVWVIDAENAISTTAAAATDG